MLTTLRHVSLVALTLALLADSALAQGPLIPPGPPAPTMKSLDQLESRTLIPGGTAAYTITGSGSYVLTGNLTVASGDAIVISADNVTLDLNGFTIANNTGSVAGSGVLINGSRTNVAVRNGLIVGGTTYSGSAYSNNVGFYNGVFASSSARIVRIEKVSVASTQRGIYLALTDDSGAVQDCTVNVALGSGITAATVSGSIARTCGGDAIAGKTITGCAGTSTGGNGINADSVADCSGLTSATSTANPVPAGISAVTASNSSGTSTASTATGSATANGLSAQVAINCRGTSTLGIGLSALQAATNCLGFSTSGTGLSAGTASQCVGASSGGTGLIATIGVACRGSGATPFTITNRYNMP